MCRPNLTLLIFTALNTHREDFNFKFFEALKIIAEGLFLMLASLKKNPTTAVVKRADWTETIVKHDRVCSTHFLSEKVQ